MSGFFRQLCFLLWKNILTKWRQKIWLAIELLVPLLLFAMLAIIRTKDFTESQPYCHYDSKGLPSAGILPFTHSFLCSLGNKCHRVPTTGDEGFYLNNNTGTNTSLIVDVLHYASLQLREIGRDHEGFEKALRVSMDIIHQLTEWNTTEFQVLKMSTIFGMTDEETKKFFEGMGATSAISTALGSAIVTPAFAINIFSEANKFVNVSECLQSSLFSLADCDLSLNVFCDRSQFQESFVLPPGTELNSTDFGSICPLRPGIGSVFQILALLNSANMTSILKKTFKSQAQLMNIVQSVEYVNQWIRYQPLNNFPDFGRLDSSDFEKTITCSGKFLDGMEGPIKKKNKPEVVYEKLRTKISEYIHDVTPGKRKTNKMTCGKVPLRKEKKCPLFEDEGPEMVLLNSLLNGYILISPASPAVEGMMRKLEGPLRKFHAFKEFAARWETMADKVQEKFAKSMLPKAAKQIRQILTMSQHYLPHDVETLMKLEKSLQHLFASPKDPNSLSAITKKIAKLFIKVADCFEADRFFLLENEEELEETATCLDKQNQYLSGIVFMNISENSTEFDPFTTYKIRHKTRLVDSTFKTLDKYQKLRGNVYNDLKYLTFGFSFLQESIDWILIEELTGKRPETGIYAQQHPFPCNVSDAFMVAYYIGTCLILSFLVPASLLVKNIVLEKEMKLKEQMRIMGLGDAVHFISWALVTLFTCFLSGAGAAVILKYSRVIEKVDISLLITVIFLFIFCTVMMSLFISTLFTNANMATGATTLIFFLCMFPYQLADSLQNYYLGYVTLLFPQTVICYTTYIIAGADWADGARWENLMHLFFKEFEVTLSECLMALGVDSILFAVLAWYISAIFPGVYGVSQKFYFPFTKAYWFPNSCIRDDDIGDKDFEYPDDDNMFEKEPEDEKLSVAIKGLTKVYKGGTMALNGLNMRLYEGQITALLGHNGAGKTTTMSMLCGLYSPSGGNASIYNRDLRREMSRVRDVLGVCPQQNVLFPLLTVSEQLRLFAALKGTPITKLYAAAREILKAVNLTEKADSLAHTLSGGQKRRLCIGIALIGGSKFVILDEPTAGVDVNSRKDIWKLLQKNKHGRTILLSTHHMDEADVLSDRVAVLSEGKLVTVGSPVFLKKRFGESMELVACKKNKKKNYDESIEKVESESPLGENVKRVDSNDDEIMFSIPIATDSQELEKFLRWFEQNLPVLEFSDYGISAPRLQQIFLKLAPSREYIVPKAKSKCCTIICGCCCKKAKKETKHSSKADSEPETIAEERIAAKGSPEASKTDSKKKSSESKNSKSETSYNFDIPLPVKGIVRIFSHIRALLMCRLNYTRRNIRAAIFELILPLALILGAETYTVVTTSTGLTRPVVDNSQPPLPLVTSTMALADSYISVWDRNRTSNSHKIVRTFMGKAGMGTLCVNSSRQMYKGLTEAAKYTTYHNKLGMAKCNYSANPRFNWTYEEEVEYNDNTRQCSCEDRQWNCTAEDFSFENYTSFELKSDDRLWDFSKQNISQIVLDTTFHYKTNGYRYRKPYFMGGYSLGHRNPRAPSSKQVYQSQMGWRVFLKSLEIVAKGLNFDDSNLGEWTDRSEFSGNISVTDVVDAVLGSLDAEENVKLWFNNHMWPSLPTEQSVISNALLRVHRNKTKHGAQELGILTINHPINETAPSQLREIDSQKATVFRVLLILMVMCTLPAGFTIFLVEDRVSGCLHMQMVSGLSKLTYWITTFVFDITLFTVSSMLILAIMAAFQIPEFLSVEAFYSFLTVFVTYGLCAIPWAYILQRFFSVASMSFIFISVGTFFMGSVTTIVVTLFEKLMSSDETMVLPYKICHYSFMLLPQYNLGAAIIRGTIGFLLRHTTESILDQLNREDLIDKAPIPHLMHWDLMGIHIAVLGAQAVLALLVFIAIEHGTFGICRRRERSNAESLMELEEAGDDDDVAAEEKRVEELEDGACPLVVRELAKAYTKKQLSVKGVSFAVDGGECFGLLGLNGAGKTTTFGMLTGKMWPSTGTVAINGVPVERGSSSAFTQVGYCPQFDALNALLTTRENLVFFARLRSIPEKAISSLADQLLRALHLRPYSSTKTASLSGGNKRKLSVAIALISQPSLILLDEPSAGMDPGSQQFLWRVIERLRRSGKAVVMTSHSMEECEALCTRIAIMDRGKVRCLGSKQHLKNKFGEGYSLTLKLCNSDQIKMACKQILRELEEARVESVHCSTIFFHIERKDTTMAQIVGAVNKIKTQVQLEDFSLSQATLDDIFLTLAANTSSNEE